MSQAFLTLHDLLPAQELKAAIDAGHVTRKAHPELPLSIYTYTRTAQYERVWNQVTTRCRGLVADDTTSRIVALPLPKFFNVGEHESGQPYAPSLPDEPFEVYDKVDGSLAVVFHYAGTWRAASKGSFISEQATWAQRRLDGRDTARLVPGVTYLAEVLYPQNRIVVDYGDRRDLVLLAAFGRDGTEVPLAEAAGHWRGIGSVVTVWPAMPLAELLALTESSTLPGGAPATGTDAEGFVLRFASGVRAKAKIAEYVRLHKVLTGVTERDIWRGHGIQRFAGCPPSSWRRASIAPSRTSRPVTASRWTRCCARCPTSSTRGCERSSSGWRKPPHGANGPSTRPSTRWPTWPATEVPSPGR
ncbi:RNA ligase [Streptomyces sp. NPDC051578]|uniref:RNA ligase n=1 Tax=Streptomyces sp. NPDC051578 TaxID=3365662 RepID=UPI00378C2B50